MFDFPGGSVVKNLPTSAGDTGDLGLIPGQEDPLLQYSCLENSMDRGAWWATVPWGHKESDMTEQLSTPVYTYIS